jgi:T4-like virus tail tube protein gp19
MVQSMGLGYGLPTSSSPGTACKRKFRWLFNINDVSGAVGSVQALPPQKSERPSLTFRETTIQHINETIYYPAKPDWKPVTLVLYDLATNTNPVFTWIQNAYDPTSGNWFPATNGSFIKDATLNLFDGCGNIIESWTYENAWPQQSDFGDLDMGNSELCVCTVTIRYARAYISS